MSSAQEPSERNEPVPPLSPSGEARRLAILALAEGALRRRVRRRRLQRTAIATAGLAVTLGILALALPRRPHPSTTPVVQAPQPAEPLPATLDLPYRFAVIDDEELLRELESAGVGLVQIGVEAPRLVTADGRPYEGFLARERSPG